MLLQIFISMYIQCRSMLTKALNFLKCVLVFYACSRLQCAFSRRFTARNISKYILENDIVVADDIPKLLKNSVKSDSSYIWRDGIIPYFIDTSTVDINGQEIFSDVVRYLEERTCLRFVPYDQSSKANYIFVSDLGGCWSFVGRQVERTDGQELSLSPSCWDRATVSHEIMHMLGYYHEHSRFDRDDYIAINLHNVDRKHWPQFDKRGPDETDLLTDYDYRSILHYNSYAWAVDKSTPTIKAKNIKKVATIGQSQTFSDLDILKINKLYKCQVKNGSSPRDFDFAKKNSTNSGETRLYTFQSIDSANEVTGKCPKGQQSCADSDLACPLLAQQGWCELMPGKMLTECKKSCCNCQETRCMDTSEYFYSKNFCYSGSYYEDGQFNVIRYPFTCYAKQTSRAANDFCPKLCGKCNSPKLF